eukprot:scaffold3012_cov70-Phaeocystis_antarctica.AAC.1
MHVCDCRNEGAPPPVFFFGGGGGVPSAPGAPRKVSVPPNLASSSLTLTVALTLILTLTLTLTLQDFCEHPPS